MNLLDYGETIEKETEFVIFGIPWDYLTSIKAPNSALAPDAIREISDNLALTSEMGIDITKIKAVDIGNVPIEEKKVDVNLKEIQNFVDKIYSQNDSVKLIMIGGDHFCSFPVVKAVGDHYSNKDSFGVLLFDAHLDFYQEWDKGVYSHATVSHRIYDLDFINNNNLIIVGTRDIDVPEKKLATDEKIEYINNYLLSELGIETYTQKIIDFLKQSKIKNIYISIDIDALDPSIAPGTGFAIPGGLSYRELWLILRKIAKEFNIIAFDVVEVAPNLDLPNKVTSNLAIKIIIELMSFISKNNEVI